MLELWLHPDAEDDLTNMEHSAPGARAWILALLEQLEVDKDLLDRLVQEDFESRTVPRFDIDAIESLQKLGLNIWRLKLWTGDEREIFFRVIYGFDRETNDYSILGIVPRSVDYQPEHPRIRKIIVAYDELEIPRI